MKIRKSRTKLSPTAAEAGSATIWAVGLICLLAVLAVGIGLLGGALSAKARAQTGADFAALAAAQAHFYGTANTPCTVATQVARENAVSLDSCILSARDVQVSVRIKTVFNWQLKAHSRAGPAINPP